MYAFRIQEFTNQSRNNLASAYGKSSGAKGASSSLHLKREEEEKLKVNGSDIVLSWKHSKLGETWLREHCRASFLNCLPLS